MMLSRRDPYLWIHLAGFATVPIWLDLCLAGLAVGDPVVPPWLELTTLGWVGTVPILWMQLQRPFYVFSLLVLALRPDRLSEERRRFLTLQRATLSRVLVGMSAVVLFLVLVWLYRLSPIAATTTPFATQTRTMGWLICAIAFLLANLFTLVPATVLAVLLTPDRNLAQTPPYESAAIPRGFSIVGFPVSRLLPAPPSPADPLSPTKEAGNLSPDLVNLVPSAETEFDFPPHVNQEIQSIAVDPEAIASPRVSTTPLSNFTSPVGASSTSAPTTYSTHDQPPEIADTTRSSTVVRATHLLANSEAKSTEVVEASQLLKTITHPTEALDLAPGDTVMSLDDILAEESDYPSLSPLDS
jgi:hypothetical protein